MPDIVIQFAFCLDAFDSDVPGGNARQFVKSVIQDQITNAAASLQTANSLYAGIIPKVPVINSICFNGTERLGITLIDNSGGTNNAPAGLTAMDNQQIVELQNLQLPAGTLFSVQVTPQGLNRVMGEVWAKLTSMSKRVDSDGQPDAKGQIQLNSYTLVLGANVVLVVNGTYHTDTKTAPDVPFKVITIDNYVVQQMMDGASSRGVVVDMATVNIDPNLSALKSWERGISAAIGLFGGIFGIAPIEVFQQMVDSQISSGLAGVSLGPSIGSLFQSIFISQVLIPGGDMKLSVNYTSVTTDPINGIWARTTFLPKIERRNPSVTITGPQLVTQIGTIKGASGTYTAVLTDIDNPTSAVWSFGAKTSFMPLPGQGPVPLEEIATFPIIFGGPAYKAISVEVNDDSGLGPFKASLVVMVIRFTEPAPAKPKIPRRLNPT